MRRVRVTGVEDATYGEMLARLAARDPRVHTGGWLDQADLNRHLAMADLAVFPASQSVLWQQSIAMGLPLIVGDTGDQDISYPNTERKIIHSAQRRDSGRSIGGGHRRRHRRSEQHAGDE